MILLNFTFVLDKVKYGSLFNRFRLYSTCEISLLVLHELFVLRMVRLEESFGGLVFDCAEYIAVSTAV